MIKKIAIRDLREGMFIHDLDCDWLTHPFLVSQFKITGEAQLEKIASIGIHEVYIDTDKGLDVPDAPTEDEVKATLQQNLLTLATQLKPADLRCTHAEELHRARAIRSRAQQLVRTVMADARLGRAVEVEKTERMVEQITESILRNSGALLGLLTIKNKDDYTFLHSVAVCALLVAFSRAQGMDDAITRQIGMGGLLHDTGKSLVPNEVLNKPGKLTEAEFEMIRRHPRDGYEILKRSPEIGVIPLDITLHHHERMDGQGYPDKLGPEKLPEFVKMSSIVDVYDAITSDRCYHRGMPATDGLRKLLEWSAFHFDPTLVQAFIRCVGIYPVGSLVRLASGRLGIVIEQNESNLLLPKLKIIFSTKSNARVAPYELDLSRSMGSGGADEIVGHEDPLRWQLDILEFITL